MLFCSGGGKSGNERGIPWSFNLADDFGDADRGHSSGMLAAGADRPALEESSGFGSIPQARHGAGGVRNPLSSRFGRPVDPDNPCPDARARTAHIPFPDFLS
jgi:hypothetical protein